MGRETTMKVPIVSSEGKEVGTREVLAAWESRRVVPALLHQAVVTAGANVRIPWAHAKGRGDVRGGGRKPWRQKGTGRARHGSIRSPLWKGGGSSFGPRKERTYGKRLPETMRRVALAMALVTKVRDGQLSMVERFPDTAKTKELAAFLQGLGIGRSALLISARPEGGTLTRAGRNLSKLRVMPASGVTAADVLRAARLVATPESWDVLESRLSPVARSAAELRPRS